MYSSPLKKPKLEDVETNKEIDQANQNPRQDDLGIDWEDECYREAFGHMTDEEIKEYRRYNLQVQESDGFDVEFVPKVFPKSLESFIVPCEKKDPKEWEMISNSVDSLIEQYNSLMKDKSRLQLVGIEKANRTQTKFSTLYITFDAEDESGDIHTYQAQVSRYCEFDGSPSLRYPAFLLSVRKKGQKEDFCLPIDLNDQEELDRMEKYARHAVSQYNKNEEGKSVIECVRVVKAHRNLNVTYNWYWISFEAKDTKSEQVKSCSANVIYDVDCQRIGLYGDVTFETES